MEDLKKVKLYGTLIAGIALGSVGSGALITAQHGDFLYQEETGRAQASAEQIKKILQVFVEHKIWNSEARKITRACIEVLDNQYNVDVIGIDNNIERETGRIFINNDQAKLINQVFIDLKFWDGKAEDIVRACIEKMDDQYFVNVIGIKAASSAELEKKQTPFTIVGQVK